MVGKKCSNLIIGFFTHFFPFFKLFMLIFSFFCIKALIIGYTIYEARTVTMEMMEFLLQNSDISILLLRKYEENQTDVLTFLAVKSFKILLQYF